MIRLCTFVISVMFLGCASTYKTDYRVDGTNAESARESISSIYKHLNLTEQLGFYGALIKLQSEEVETTYEEKNGVTLAVLNFEVIANKVGGHTYKEIMQMAGDPKVEIEASRIKR